MTLFHHAAFRIALVWAIPWFAVSTSSSSAAESGILRFHVTDSDGDALPCRIHVRNELGQSEKPAGLPFWNDHFVCPGHAEVPVMAGKCHWQIERGPEFQRLSGTVVVGPQERVDVTETCQRLPSLRGVKGRDGGLRDEGWYSADLHVHRPVSDIKLLMSAEDLDFSPVIEWWNNPQPGAIRADQTEFRFDEHRIYSIRGGEDEREGGALLFVGLKRSIDLAVVSREFPSPMQFVKHARHQNSDVWIDVEKPFWWDVPTWLAVANPSSIGIAHNHMHRSGVLANEAWGKARDPKRFAGIHGNGLWTQQIYYHMLNSGIRVPPSAGSASGVLPNPVGYNRVYVQLGDAPLSRDRWFAALRAGRCFVTNGPLLRVKANGQWPGATLRVGNEKIKRDLSNTGAGRATDDPKAASSPKTEALPLKVKLEVEMASSDPVSAVEIVFNGDVVRRLPWADKQQPDTTQRDWVTTLDVTEPGWFLVRAIADVDDTFRFASTAPWYVDVTGAPRRISRSSVAFFREWLEERIARVAENVQDTSEREAVMRWHLEARQFWKQRWEQANAD